MPVFVRLPVPLMMPNSVSVLLPVTSKVPPFTPRVIARMLEPALSKLKVPVACKVALFRVNAAPVVFRPSPSLAPMLSTAPPPA